MSLSKLEIIEEWAAENNIEMMDLIEVGCSNLEDGTEGDVRIVVLEVGVNCNRILR